MEISTFLVRFCSLLLLVSTFLYTAADQFEQLQSPLAVQSLKVNRQNVTILADNVNQLHYVFQVTIRPRNEAPRIERLNEALMQIGRTPGMNAGIVENGSCSFSSQLAHSSLSNFIE